MYVTYKYTSEKRICVYAYTKLELTRVNRAKEERTRSAAAEEADKAAQVAKVEEGKKVEAAAKRKEEEEKAVADARQKEVGFYTRAHARANTHTRRERGGERKRNVTCRC